MGIWSDVSDKSRYGRLIRFIYHALNTPYDIDGVFVLLRVRTSVVSTFMVSDLAWMVPGKFHFAVPASRPWDGTDLLRRIK